MSAIKQPLLALETDLRVKSANQAFYQMFKVTPDETENRPIYELGQGQWNLPRLRTLLEEIVNKQQPVDDYQMEADFPHIGRRKVSLDARVYAEDQRNPRLIILSIRDLTAGGKK